MNFIRKESKIELSIPFSVPDSETIKKDLEIIANNTTRYELELVRKLVQNPGLKNKALKAAKAFIK